jgi:hypothetical protein
MSRATGWVPRTDGVFESFTFSSMTAAEVIPAPPAHCQIVVYSLSCSAAGNGAVTQLKSGGALGTAKWSIDDTNGQRVGQSLAHGIFACAPGENLFCDPGGADTIVIQMNCTYAIQPAIM